MKADKHIRQWSDRKGFSNKMASTFKREPNESCGSVEERTCQEEGRKYKGRSDHGCAGGREAVQRCSGGEEWTSWHWLQR